MADEDETSASPTTTATTAPAGRVRKQPRPEIQIYRPGMLRKGDSTKSLASDERPPRPERIESSGSSVTNRRRSNDTDSIHSRGGSGCTTPDANQMNERYANSGSGTSGGRRSDNRKPQNQSYNSTQSLYDTRKSGGYAEYNGGSGSSSGRGGGGGSGGQTQQRNYSALRQNKLPFERNFNRGGNGYNERASMRGDVAITKRNGGAGGGGRRRHDSINSTQSEMPQPTSEQLHIDTESASQCGAGASSNYSLPSFADSCGDMSLEELCQSMQSFTSMDWSKQVEDECRERMEQEEEEEKRKAAELQASLQEAANKKSQPKGVMRVNNWHQQHQNGASSDYNGARSPRGGSGRYGRRNRRDESDRESSFGGSIAEEEGEEDDGLRSGERTPTSTRDTYGYQPRQYNNSRANNRNNENGHRYGQRGGNKNEYYDNEYAQTREERDAGWRPQNGARAERPQRRSYRGEHDDRDDEGACDYEESLPPSVASSGRLAGRISLAKPKTEPRRKVDRERNADEGSDVVPVVRYSTQQQVTGSPREEGTRRSEKTKTRVKHSPEEASTSSSAEPMPKATSTTTPTTSSMSREEMNRRRYEQIAKNEGLEILKINDEISKLLPYVSKKKSVEAAKKAVELSGKLASIYADILTPDIVYAFANGLEQHLFRQAFHKNIEALRSGANSTGNDAKMIRVSLQRLLLDGIEFYETLIKKYESTFDIDLSEALDWPTTGTPSDEELMSTVVEVPRGVEKYMKSGTQKTALKSLARHFVSLGDLHRYKTLVDGSENYSVSQSCYLKVTQLWPSSGHPYNQLGVVAYYATRVLDEIFFLSRALACAHPYEASKDRLAQRLAAMRAKVSKYEPLLDSECGTIRDEEEMIARMDRAREIWINVDTGKATDDTGENIVADVFEHFVEQPASKLHRRAVSYIVDTFGMLVTKIGMEHIGSVSERAIALLCASLTRSDSDFSSRQLVQISMLFLYAVHSTKLMGADAEDDVCSVQQQFAIRALSSIFVVFCQVLLEEVDNVKSALDGDSEEINRKAKLVLPALNVICEWYGNAESRKMYERVPSIDPLSSSILPMSIATTLKNVVDVFGDVKRQGREVECHYPEHMFMSSFFNVFEAKPSTHTVDCVEGDSMEVKATRGRISRLVETCRILMTTCQMHEVEEDDVSGLTTRDEDEEAAQQQPLTREKILELERKKSKYVLVVRPENVVPDTNALIDHLEVFKRIVASSNSHGYQIVLPTIVISELINLSQLARNDSIINDVGGGGHEEYVRTNAKAAVTWIKEQARAKNQRMSTLTTQGKKIGMVVANEEVENKNGEKMINDDFILQSCLQLSDSTVNMGGASKFTVPQNILGADTSDDVIRHRNIVLISEDRGLTIKATSQQMPCRTVQSFVKWAGL